jgi:hypothetical protein
MQLRSPDDVSDDMHEHGVPGGASNLNSTGYPDHGRYGNLPLQGKISMAQPGIEPETSWLVVKSSDHQAMKLVIYIQCMCIQIANVIIHNYSLFCNIFLPHASAHIRHIQGGQVTKGYIYGKFCQRCA